MSSRRSHTHSRREAGSAYLIALLVLLILTGMGLSLATVTQLEMEVGSAEKSITRTFYGADSGSAVALSQALVTGLYEGRQIDLFSENFTNRGSSVVNARGYRIDVSTTVPILREACNLCGTNENPGEGGGFYRINHAVTATATELTWLGNDKRPAADASIQAQKTISTMIDVEPWFAPPVESIPIAEPDLAKIKF